MAQALNAIEAARRSQLMLDAIAQSVIATDLAGVVTYWNRAAEQMYGWPAEEAMGRPAGELIVAETDRSVGADIVASLSAGSSWTGEFPVRRRDGSRFLALVTDSGIYDDAGQLVGIIGVSTDITQLKAAEQTQRETERQLRAVVDNSPVVLISFDSAGTVVLAEGRDLTSLNPPTRSLTGTPLTAIETQAPVAAGAIRRALAGESSNVTVPLNDKQLDFRCRPSRDSSGLVIGVMAIALDITDSLRAVQQTREQEALLQALEAQSADVAMIADYLTAELTYVSPAVTRLFGWRPEELLGKPAASVFHPDDLDRVRQSLECLVTEPGAHRTVEYRFKCADGTYRRVENTVTNLAEVPAVRGLVGNIRDITERVAAEDALRSSEARFRLIAETAQEGIWATNKAGLTVFANQKMADLLGLPLTDFYDKPVWELVTGTTRAGFEARRRQRDQQHGTQRYDLLHTRPDGSPRILRVVVSPFDYDGQSLGSLAMVSDITESRANEDRLQHRASHDALTGLANRTLLMDSLCESLDDQAGQVVPLAVLVADIDQFKLINDSFGHAAGDELLTEVSRRWEEALGSEGLLARLGGDEFAVLCRGADADSALAIAHRLMDTFAESMTLDGRQVAISASIGIAVTQPPERVSAETMLRHADTAMYEAKSQGRSRVELFTPHLIDRSQHRLRLFNDLKLAIENDELVLHYQPVVDLNSGALLGVEALCRWTHAERGVVPPDVFVRAAESNGLIDALDRWVLKRACTDAAAMRAAGVLPSHGFVAVNTSASPLAHPDFEQAVCDLLASVGLPAHALVLEVTESVVMSDPEAAEVVLAGLRRRGIKVAIDDFGTGYSSLGYLRRFPVSTLKIDRSFLRNITTSAADLAIVTAVVDLAKALEMTTTAEGVETAADLAILQELGCQAGQGYLWSPAVSPHELALLVGGLPDGRFRIRCQPTPVSPVRPRRSDTEALLPSVAAHQQ
jgi:diguanylate cyclase (GGDEF)-like protein/PAS domain S-box-containing protein